MATKIPRLGALAATQVLDMLVQRRRDTHAALQLMRKRSAQRFLSIHSAVHIQHAIWLYLRFTLSYRDVEELLAERGLDVS